MNRLQLGLARAGTILLTLLFWVWLAVKSIVTLIGATTVGDDYNQFVERLPAVLTWLYSTPWWVPGGLATALTVFLIWLSWPRQTTGLQSQVTTEGQPRIFAGDGILSRALPITPIATASARRDNPQFRSELTARKYQIQTWIDGLLAEALFATQRRKSREITQSQFDDEIRVLAARRNGGISQYADDLIEDAAKLAPDGTKTLNTLRTTARAGNYRHGGEFLSSNHASLIATLDANKKQFADLIDGALLRAKSSLGDRVGSMTLRLNYKPGRDQILTASIIPAKKLTDVVALGSYAVTAHYETHAEWKWCLPQRLAERANLIVGELIDVPFVERMHISSNPQDRTILAGSELVLPKGTDMIEGCLVLVKIEVSTGDGEFVLKRLLNLRLGDGRQFIDTLDLDAHAFIEDRSAKI